MKNCHQINNRIWKNKSIWNQCVISIFKCKKKELAISVCWFKSTVLNQIFTHMLIQNSNKPSMKYLQIWGKKIGWLPPPSIINPQENIKKYKIYLDMVFAQIKCDLKINTRNWLAQSFKRFQSKISFRIINLQNF